MFVHNMTVQRLKQPQKADFGTMTEKALQVHLATDNAVALRSAANIFRATAFAWTSCVWAKLQQKTGKSGVYVYFFDQSQPSIKYGNPQENATHTDEINYVFGNIN